MAALCLITYLCLCLDEFDADLPLVILLNSSQFVALMHSCPLRVFLRLIWPKRKFMNPSLSYYLTSFDWMYVSRCYSFLVCLRLMIYSLIDLLQRGGCKNYRVHHHGAFFRTSLQECKVTFSLSRIDLSFPRRRSSWIELQECRKSRTWKRHLKIQLDFPSVDSLWVSQVRWLARGFNPRSPLQCHSIPL